MRDKVQYRDVKATDRTDRNRVSRDGGCGVVWCGGVEKGRK